MSDIRYNLYETKTESYYISLSCGKRESVFSYNGKSTKAVECGVLSLYCNNFNILPKELSVKIKYDNKEINATLEKSPYEQVFMTDIEKILECEEVYVSIDSVGENIKLENKNLTISYHNALEIAIGELENQISKNIYNNRFNAECYLKIVTPNNTNFEGYFWFFSIISKDKSFSNCVIDANSGKIILVNK